MISALSAFQLGATAPVAAAGSPTTPAPTTKVLLPPSGTVITFGSWLDASAQSPVGIRSVNFIVSGGSVTNMVVSRPAVITPDGWIGGFDGDDLADGTYTLQSVATDKLGNTATSPGVTVTVDLAAINTEIGVPSNGAALHGVAVLDSAASAISDVIQVQYFVNGSSIQTDRDSDFGRRDRDDHSAPSDHVVAFLRSDRESGAPGDDDHGGRDPEFGVPGNHHLPPGVSGRWVANGRLTVNGWISLWDTRNVPNGSYTLQTVAIQVGGGTAVSQPVQVTVQNNCPDKGKGHDENGQGDDNGQGDEGNGNGGCHASGRA
jgi:hypothetical protein